MRPAILGAALACAALAATFAAPASAQTAGNVSASIDTSAVDTARITELRCRLRLVNPRACARPQATPSQRQAGSTRPTGGPGGGPRPRR